MAHLPFYLFLFTCSSNHLRSKFFFVNNTVVKPQQQGTFVIEDIEHQKESFSKCRRARIANRWLKIILDTYQRPQEFYRQKIRWVQPNEFDSMVRILSSDTSESDEKTRLEINFYQRNKSWQISPDGSQRGITISTGKTPWLLKCSVEFILFSLKQF